MSAQTDITVFVSVGQDGSLWGKAAYTPEQALELGRAGLREFEREDDPVEGKTWLVICKVTGPLEYLSRWMGAPVKHSTGGSNG